MHKILALTGLVASLAVTPVTAAALDPSFGNAGSVTFRFDPDNAVSVAHVVRLDSSGRIYVGGYLGPLFSAVERFSAAGVADAGFTSPSPWFSSLGFIQPVLALHPLADGLLVGGRYTVSDISGPGISRPYGPYFGRLSGTGALDPALNGSGVAPSYSVYGEGGAVAVLGLSGGRFYGVNGRYVARHLADGSLDPTFTATALPFIGTDALVMGDEIVVFGILPFVAGPQVMFARYHPAGGTAQTGTTQVSGAGAPGSGVAGALQAGKFLLGTSAVDGRGSLVRLDLSGVHDSSFGVTGRVNLPGTVHDVSVLADDRIVVRVGKRTLMRLGADGMVDLGFGSQGAFTLPHPVELADMTVQADGRIVVAGTQRQANGESDGYLARIDPAGTSALALSQGVLSFGVQSVGTQSAPLEVTITNTAGVATPIALSLGSVDFDLAHDCPASLAPGASCRATVSFAPWPSAFGTVDEQLLVTTGSPATSRAVALIGTVERAFVTHFYRSILRREPDPDGRAYWLGLDALLLAQRGESALAMAQNFFGSAEYASFARNDAGFVTDLYATFFDRAPDSQGMAFWLGQLAGGMPRDGLMLSFMFSPEFTFFVQANLGDSLSTPVRNLTMDFYRGLLARYPDRDGFNYWLNRLIAAQCRGAASVYAEVDAISSGFIASAEYLARGRDTRGYVVDLYNAFLRRGPDLAGLQFWVDRIDSGANSRDEVRDLFMASAEFDQRVQAAVQTAVCE